MQFDVYRNLNKNTQKSYPYLLDIQNDTVDTKRTRVVVPLSPARLYRKPAKILNPLFDIEGESCVMLTQDLASIGSENLRDFVCSLKEHRNEIIHAFDFLITGF